MSHTEFWNANNKKNVSFFKRFKHLKITMIIKICLSAFLRRLNLQKRWWRRYLSTGSLILVFLLWLNIKKSRDQLTRYHSLGQRHKSYLHLLWASDQSRYNGAKDVLWIFRKLLTSPGRHLDPLILYDLSQPVVQASNWTCLNTTTRPSFPICIYEPAQDKYISAQLLSEGVWEPRSTKLFQEALRIYPTATVIDLGANIGSYALLAAKTGHQVIAVEPLHSSISRLHRASQLANTSKSIVMIAAAVSDRHEMVTLRYQKGNMGGTSVQPVNPNEINSIIQKDKFGVVSTITMDDLTNILSNSSTTKIIIKMDIEGYECKALATSSLLFAKFYVAYIFMEWETMFKNRHRYHASCQPTQLQATVDHLWAQGYHPFAAKTGHRLDPKQGSTNWRIGDVIWIHERASKLRIGR